MHSSLPFKKLDQHGFDHVLAALTFAVVFALGGTYLLIHSHANPWSGSLRPGLDQSLCMEDIGGPHTKQNAVATNKCDTARLAQQWTLKTVGYETFQIVAATSHACIEDTQQPGTSSTIATTPLQTHPCSTSDHAQIWEWSGKDGHQLADAYRTNDCISDPNNSRSAGTTLVVAACSGTTHNSSPNTEWFEGLNTTVAQDASTR